MNRLPNMRNRHFFVLDLLAMISLPALALTLRLEGLSWCAHGGQALLFFTLVALLVKMPIFCGLRLYKRYWLYAVLSDLTMLLGAVVLSTAILTVLFGVAHTTLAQYNLAMYRSVPLIDGLLLAVAVSGFRFALKWFHRFYHRRQERIGGRRVLVVGAGEAGRITVQEMRANPQLDMEPVAFVDDDTSKIGTYIENLQVLGPCAQIPELVEGHEIQRIVVAVPSVPLQRQLELLTLCEQTGIPTHNLPGIYDLLAGHKTISRLPKIDINRLLHRDAVTIDQTEAAAFIGGAKVLVTGAGGSIGGELCRQVARLNPAEIVLLGHGENSITEIGLDLSLSFPDLVTHQVIADIRDCGRIDKVIEGYRPELIFHAAAHKHVPLMESNSAEAITNNVLGTQNVLRAAENHGVERLVLISTDKAVNPTSVMGATKRLAEMLVVATAQSAGRAYIAVRFGNVLGSRGSVVPVFQQQIAAGGPITVTHPEMCRYFMTIPEAVQLVLQATVLGEGGEVFILDMGQPVRILDLATDLIKLSGLEPGSDIKIRYSGIRPGEKLDEELFLGEEHHQRTRCSKIYVATCAGTVELEPLEHLVNELADLVQTKRSQIVDAQMRTLLPEICCYLDNHWPQPQPSLPERLSPRLDELPTDPSNKGIPVPATQAAWSSTR